VRPRRLLAVAVLAVAALVVPAAMADLATEKQALDTRIDRLRSQIGAAKEREQLLTSDIAAASEQIDVISGRVDELGGVVAALEEELARHRARLEELRDLYERQTRILSVLEENERISQERLANRVVAIYTSDRPTSLEVLLSVRSLDELVSQLGYLDEIVDQDRRIAEEVAEGRRELAAERRKTERIKDEETATTALLAERTAEQRAALGELVARRDELVGAQNDRETLLGSLQERRHEAEEDVEALAQASAELGERIRRHIRPAARAGRPVALSGRQAGSSGR
jgi:peptidoglycan hydrolase CwlO-like protein